MRALSLICTIGAACGPAAQPDVPDAAPPRCGDGIVTPNREDPAQHEQCDDGDATGGPDSVCTLDCVSGVTFWTSFPEDTTQLPFPSKKTVFTGSHFIISNFDDDGIAAVPYRNVSRPIFFKQYTAPISFNVGEIDNATTVMWVEREIPNNGGPWLLWAKLESSPIISEVPYPLADHDGIVFVRGGPLAMRGIGFKDSNGHLRRIHFEDLSPSLRVYDWDLGPAPDGTLAEARRMPWGEGGPWVAYLFAAGEVTNIVVATDPVSSIQPSVVWRGTWGTPILDTDTGRNEPGVPSENLKLLTPDGSVYLWSFLYESEVQAPRFGSVSPGAQRFDGLNDIESVNTQGQLEVLVNNGVGRGLALQRLQIGPPCTVCSIAETDGTPEFFTLDTTLVHGFANRYPSNE